jgi:hypothetical protein
MRLVNALALSLLAACPRADDKPAHLERPAPPRSGVSEARVLFVNGAVEVTPADGAPFTAREGQDLVGSDKVAPSTAAFIIVQLKNGHTVRLDDAGALGVSDILLASAAPTDVPADIQLRALLDAPELDVVPLADVKERAAAWRQMRRAAESASAERARQAPQAPSIASADAEQDAAQVLGEGKMGKKDVAAAAEQRRETSARKPEEGSDARAKSKSRSVDEEDAFGKIIDGAVGGSGSGAGPGYAGSGAAEKKVAAPPAPQAETAKAEPPPLPAGFAARFGPSAEAATDAPFPASLDPAELGACLAGAHSGSTSLTLLLEIKAGAVARVRLEGALPPPACARAWTGRSVPDVSSDGWLVLTVPLAR